MLIGAVLSLRATIFIRVMTKIATTNRESKPIEMCQNLMQQVLTYVLAIKHVIISTYRCDFVFRFG